MPKVKISNAQIISDLKLPSKKFPLYTTQIINLANQNAQGTRPKVVGKVTELFKEANSKTAEEWMQWHAQKMPNAMDNATEKIYTMILKLKDAVAQIDKKMVKEWLEDFAVKTFAGLRLQPSIIKRVAEIKNLPYTEATSSDESKNIDGYIGGEPVTVKPISHKTKNMLPEQLPKNRIYYEKVKGGIVIEYGF